MTFGELLKMNEAGAAPMGDEAVKEKKVGAAEDSGSVSASVPAEEPARKKSGRRKKGEG